MQHLPVLFTKIALIGLLAYAALPVRYVLAQEISQPRTIGDAKLAACISGLGRSIVHDGTAKAPFTVRIEVSRVTAFDRKAAAISDRVTAACVDLLAQSLVRDGNAKVPFAIRATPAR